MTGGKRYGEDSSQSVKVGVLDGEVVSPQICPDDSSNMLTLFAVEVNHEPQSVCAKDDALLNILLILVTRDTSHFDRSRLKDDAYANIKDMSSTLDTSHFETSPLNDVDDSNTNAVLS